MSVARISRCLTVLAGALCWLPAPALASWVEPLFMPGDVIAKHAPFERECEKCHERFDKAAQDALCLGCHTEVATDLEDRHGFHGQSPSVKDAACKKCHAEHRGRDAQATPLDRTTFEHRFTDFALRGGHTRVACDGCHAAGKRWREAPPLCSDCHAAKDPHGGCLGAACQTCHQEDGWNEVRFDHAKAAFALEGRHREVACDRCHTTKRYKPTPSNCVDCHRSDDRHRGAFGTGCLSCHTPRTWAQKSFDHARRTRFPLLGSHARVACANCHKPGTVADLTPTTCIGCHERNDAHRGQFGRACETCHSPGDWKRPTFQHDRDTRFRLRGLHAKARCGDCHQGELHKERLETTCYACHRDDDVHHRREGTRCESCHDESGWQREVLFDHSATRFALTGAHARTTCTRCHTAATFKDVGRECVSCHADKDVHHGNEGKLCERCHDTVSFRAAHAPQ